MPRRSSENAARHERGAGAAVHRAGIRRRGPGGAPALGGGTDRGAAGPCGPALADRRGDAGQRREPDRRRAGAAGGGRAAGGPGRARPRHLLRAAGPDRGRRSALLRARHDRAHPVRRRGGAALCRREPGAAGLPVRRRGGGAAVLPAAAGAAAGAAGRGGGDHPARTAAAARAAAAGAGGDGQLLLLDRRRPRHEHDRQGDRERLRAAGGPRRRAALHDLQRHGLGEAGERRAARRRQGEAGGGGRPPAGAAGAGLPAHHPRGAAQGLGSHAARPPAVRRPRLQRPVRERPGGAVHRLRPGRRQRRQLGGGDHARRGDPRGRPLRQRHAAVADRGDGGRRHRRRHRPRMPGDARLRRSGRGAEAGGDRRRDAARRRAVDGRGAGQRRGRGGARSLRAEPPQGGAGARGGRTAGGGGVKRLFRGLRRPPDTAYDVVVIGSGIGGPIAANLLARDGARVLLVEQHYMVGGYCSTFRRGGYTFDAATHFYPLLGNRETLTGRLLVELGVETRWVKMDPVDTFHLPDGTRFDVPAAFDAYVAMLKARLPCESAALDVFFGEVRQANLLGLLRYFRGRETPGLAPYADLTVRQALERHFRDRKLKLLLTADCPHWGSPPERTSFVFDSMLRLSYFLGNYYPRGGSQAFADELARCFEERGGHVLMSTAARRILVENGRASGVELETLRGPVRSLVAPAASASAVPAATAPAASAGGPADGRGAGRFRVRCGAVVSNADLLHTWETLVPPEHVPPGYVAGLRRLRPTYPCYLMHLGLTGVEPAALEELQGYHWHAWDSDQAAAGAVHFKLFAPTQYEPAMAPPGGQGLIVKKVLNMDYDAAEASGGWPSHKEAVDSFVLGRLERLLPGIGARIVVRSSASARTSWRFTLNHQGAMLGWEMSPEQVGAGRPDLTGPLAGLYTVGHWTRPGGGITPVIVSAQLAAALASGNRKALSIMHSKDQSLSADPRGGAAAAGFRREFSARHSRTRSLQG